MFGDTIKDLLLLPFVCLFIIIIVYVYWRTSLVTNEMSRSVNLKSTIEQELQSILIDGTEQAVDEKYRELYIIKVDREKAQSYIKNAIRDYFSYYAKELIIDDLKIYINDASVEINLDYRYKPLIMSDSYAKVSSGSTSKYIKLNSKVKIDLDKAIPKSGTQDSRDKYNTSREEEVKPGSNDNYGGGVRFDY